MPISLPPLTRREFLRGTAAAGTGLLVTPALFGAPAEAGTDRFALLADTHIPSGPDVTAYGQNMTENFRRVGAELRELTEAPAAVLIGGDCAYLTGETEDYAHLVGLLGPLRQVGLAIHLALGNHDHRQRFWNALPREDARKNAVAGRHLTVIKAPRANWFLLDSLDVTNATPGQLGEQQREWLAAVLDGYKDRPALILVHHDLDHRENTTGLRDTAALMEILVPRKHVKAVVFGHTHHWHIREQDGIHLVNLPSTAFVFQKDNPNPIGWVDAHLQEDGMKLQLRCLDRSHPRHGETKYLKWRT